MKGFSADRTRQGSRHHQLLVVRGGTCKYMLVSVMVLPYVAWRGTIYQDRDLIPLLLALPLALLHLPSFAINACIMPTNCIYHALYPFTPKHGDAGL